MPSTSNVTSREGERRRLTRLPLSCRVVITQKREAWATETEDVCLRGCRILARKPLTAGRLVQVRFLADDGGSAHEAVGQVVWTRDSGPLTAGVLFLGSTHASDASAPGRWLDVIAAAQLRRAARLRGTAGKLGELPLHLGTPPPGAPSAGELAVLRAASAGVRISAVVRVRGGLDALAGLLSSGAVTLTPGPVDPEEWAQALPQAREREARAPAPAVIALPPVPGTSWCESDIAAVIEAYLRDVS